MNSRVQCAASSSAQNMEYNICQRSSCPLQSTGIVKDKGTLHNFSSFPSSGENASAWQLLMNALTRSIVSNKEKVYIML
jgi:hypothetical protein